MGPGISTRKPSNIYENVYKDTTRQGQTRHIGISFLYKCQDVFSEFPNVIFPALKRPFNGIRHILLLFKGSVFKLIWHDVLIFTLSYYTLSLFYRNVLYPHYPEGRYALQGINRIKRPSFISSTRM